MFSQLSSLARSSIIALAALASVPAAAPAAPLGPSFIPAVADSATVKPTLVAMGEGRDNSNPAYQVWRTNRVYDGRGRNWNDGRNYRNNGGNYRGRYYGNNGGNYRHSADTAGTGGAMAGTTAAPSLSASVSEFRWVITAATMVAAITMCRSIGRAYTARSGGAHVQWCYDRYRSYRAWDNTFQPYQWPTPAVLFAL